MARNRQRNRTGRPTPRSARPFPGEGDAAKPPIEDEPPVAFGDDGDESGDVSAASAAFGPAAEPAERRPSGNRVISFLRASWAELQRVQWPDRQQVAQATGVVLGFVIITGIFLGVADYVAGKIINAII